MRWCEGGGCAAAARALPVFNAPFNGVFLSLLLRILCICYAPRACHHLCNQPSGVILYPAGRDVWAAQHSGAVHQWISLLPPVSSLPLFFLPFPTLCSMRGAPLPVEMPPAGQADARAMQAAEAARLLEVGEAYGAERAMCIAAGSTAVSGVTLPLPALRRRRRRRLPPLRSPAVAHPSPTCLTMFPVVQPPRHSQEA